MAVLDPPAPTPAPTPVASPARGRWLVALSAALAAAAAVLTVGVVRSDLLPGEAATSRWLSARTNWASEPLVDLVDVAFDEVAAPVIFFCLLPIVWIGWGRYAGLTFLGAGALTGLTKVVDAVGRPRPTEDLTLGEFAYGSGGYPSGHTVYAVLVFGTLAYLAGVHLPRSRARMALQAGLVAIPVLVGPLRVMDEDHWPADVVGGYLLALPALFAVIWLHRHLPGWLERHAPGLRRVVGVDGASQ